MRRVLPLLAVVLLSGLSAGVVGADCPDGQPCITSGGDDTNISEGGNASAPDLKIKRNGSDWRAMMQIDSVRPENDVSEQLGNASSGWAYNMSTITFEGVIDGKSSCDRPDFNVSRGEEHTYSLEIGTSRSEGGEGVCTEVISEISYSMRFRAETPFRLEVSQGNLSKTFTHPDYQESGETGEKEQGNSGNSQPESDRGLLAGLISWLGSLF